jgi:dihydroflavonol-4-reductase
MDVLVTGGAGYIGSHLVQCLLARGAAVRVLEHPAARVGHLPLDRLDLVRGDIRDRAQVARAAEGCREVYHLAANPHLWTQRRGDFLSVNYQGTINVLAAALEAKVVRILHTSTESILTRARQSQPIAEDQTVRPCDVLGPYCRSKFLAEQHAFELARQGAPIVIVNPTLPVGPGDWGCSPPTRMMLDFCRGKRREYVDAELNLIDVRDVADGMIRAMQHGRTGRRYLLGHENMSVREVFRELARLTALPEPHRRVPYPLALAAAYISEWVADVATHRSPAATVTGVKLTRRRMHFDPRRSLDELNLRPRPISESLADAVAWFREVGWINGGPGVRASGGRARI